MLVLSRKSGESIQIGNDITITITKIAGDKVKLGFEVPKHVPIVRSELKEKVAANEPPDRDRGWG